MTKSPTIVNGNALRIDWKDVVPPEVLSYILGDPPFSGAMVMSENALGCAVYFVAARSRRISQRRNSVVHLVRRTRAERPEVSARTLCAGTTNQ